MQRLLPILKNIPLLANLDDKIYEAILANLDTLYFKKGQIVFKKGDEANALFIIKSGRVLVYQPTFNQEIHEEVATLGENDFFGEMGLVTHEPRNASVKTIEDSIFFVLTKADFQLLLSENAAAANQISEEFVKRYKDNTKRIKKEGNKVQA